MKKIEELDVTRSIEDVKQILRNMNTEGAIQFLRDIDDLYLDDIEDLLYKYGDLPYNGFIYQLEKTFPWIKNKFIESNNKVIKIQEDVKIGNVILEKGDKIKVFEAIDISPILPLGSVNMVTGNNAMLGNIYNTWNDGNMTVEFWKSPTGKIVLIFTAGKEPIYEVGSEELFQHDQTRRPLFKGDEMTMIDYCDIKDLPEKGPKIVSKKTATAYVYK